MSTQPSFAGMSRSPIHQESRPDGDKVKISVFLTAAEHAALKHAAIDERTNLSELMADLAREYLAGDRKRRK